MVDVRAGNRSCAPRLLVLRVAKTIVFGFGIVALGVVEGFHEGGRKNVQKWVVRCVVYLPRGPM